MTSGTDEHPAPRYPDAAEKVADLLAAAATIGDVALVETANAVAEHARHLINQVEHLEHALQSNRRIGTAMGILVAHRHITEDQAFAALRRASQITHRKLHDIAADVIYTGELPSV